LPGGGQTAPSKAAILRAGGCRRGTGSRGGQRALPERGRAAPRPPAGDRRTGMEGHPLAPLSPKERTHGLPRGQRGGLETTSTLSVPLGPRGRGGEVREGEESQVNHEGWMTQCEAQAPPPSSLSESMAGHVRSFVLGFTRGAGARCSRWNSRWTAQPRGPLWWVENGDTWTRRGEKRVDSQLHVWSTECPHPQDAQYMPCAR